ncbi:MAG: GspH/FimT family protein [Rubrivivax sp.]|nr:GspH/FimT family protein [Rubrivivax sp.]
MRQLSPIRHGLTLIELMVAFAIASLLALAATPFFSDYGVNSRLREGGNLLYAESLFAQSEAIKRNRTVRLATNNNVITVDDLADPDNPVTLRTRQLPENVTIGNATVSFGSSGWPTNLAAVAFNLSHATAVCDADHRCPGLRVDAGGAIRLCGNKLSC